MKIAALVSGGVDSSVALHLLRSQGHDVTAFYLKIWLEDELAFLGNCPWQEDLEYVEKVCEKLNVPLKIVSLQKEYWDQVVSYTIAQARAGNTPNPDILCNQRIKFGAFYSKIDDSFEKVATGHYAQVQEMNGKFCLVQSPDPVKDQTYFLSHLTQKQLARALFPIGHLQKTQVRALAHEADLPTKSRKDSQGICFLGKLDFAAFLRHHLGEQEGPLIEVETGNTVGVHRGFWFFTIGQRQGLGLAGGPWYVVNKDPARNCVYISRHYYEHDKVRKSFYLGECSWILDQQPILHKLGVKIRHGQQMHDAIIDFSTKPGPLVTLQARDQGIAPGQFAALYDGVTCLGGGVITRAIL